MVISTVTIGEESWKIMDDYSLWSGDSQVGYVVDGENGYDCFDVDGNLQGTLGGSGIFHRADGYNAYYTFDVPEESNVVGTVSVTDNAGVATEYSLTSTGQVLDSQGNPMGTYRTDENNNYRLVNLQGEEYGILDPRTGTLVSNGQTMTAHYNSTGFQIPEYTDTTQTGTVTQGLDWNNPILQGLKQPLTESIQGLPELARTAGTQAQEKYVNLMNQGMGLSNYQGLLNSLAGRNMLSSSVAENALSRAGTQTAQNIANQAFMSSLANTQAQMQVPGQLGTLAGQLGGNVGTTTQKMHDPLRPYNLAAQLMY